MKEVNKAKKGNKKAVISEYLPWLLIALVLLVIMVITIFFLKEKGISLVGQIKGLFRRA